MIIPGKFEENNKHKTGVINIVWKESRDVGRPLNYHMFEFFADFLTMVQINQPLMRLKRIDPHFSGKKHMSAFFSCLHVFAVCCFFSFYLNSNIIKNWKYGAIYKFKICLRWASYELSITLKNSKTLQQTSASRISLALGPSN